MVDQQTLNTVSTFIARANAEGWPVCGGVLYGSFARGEQHQDSDIDVLVLLEDWVPRKEFSEIGLALTRLVLQIDDRIEFLLSHKSRFEYSGDTVLIDVVRREGIRIAA